ncbi:MAG: ABC transporter substrate-binding protein [Oscillospiraceae bacterium]|nr:ABC transporter substrate-binding protein [Oscillospiraceae bacterium]
MMKRILAAALVLVLALGMLTACGSSSGSSGGTTSSAPADNSERQLVVGIPGLPDNGDVQNTTSVYNRIGFGAQVYDYIMVKDGDGNILPHLVESYEMADDASECTFKLVEGVKWHDGTEMTSEDVQFTIERAKAGTGSQKTYCGDIDHVEVIDDYNFKIVMGTPNVALLEYLTAIPVVCKAFITECGDELYGTDVQYVMGSGPYKPVEWQFGDYIVFEANEDYFLGAPAIKSVKLRVVADTNSAVIELQTGGIDFYMNDVPYISLPTLEADANINVEYASSFRYNYVLFNAESGMFADKTMRQAVAYAIDRDEMLIIGCEDLQNGVEVNTPAGPDFTANPDHTTWPYETDLEKAQSIVADSGYDGHTVVIKTLTVDPYPKLATVLLEALTKIGINAEIEQLENSAYIDDVCGNGNFEIAICFNTFPAKDMDIAVNAQLHSSKVGLAGNYGRYVSEEMDELIVAAKTIPDPEARKAAYEPLIALFAEDLPSVPLYYTNSTRAYSADLVCRDNCAQYDRFYYFSFK